MTAAPVGDYRPRLDRRVARSKARPADREARRKEARRERDRASTDGGRSKACRRRKRFTVESIGRRGMLWDGGGEGGGRARIETEARETSEQEGTDEEGTTARESREGGRWPRARARARASMM